MLKLSAFIAWLRRSLSGRLVVALSAAIGAALLFTEIADEILEGEAAPVDTALSLFLRRLDSPALDAVMRAFTALGNGESLILFSALVVVWTLRHGRPALAGLHAAVSIAAGALNALLKLLFARPRPELFFEIIAPKSYSFPSGHAMASTAVYGMAAFVLARLHPRLRWPLYLCSSALFLVIGLSRVYLGVHWPSDVIGGFAAGGALVAAGVSALPRIDSAARRDDTGA